MSLQRASVSLLLVRKARHRGTVRLGGMFEFTAAVYNLVRMRTLLAPA
jgi:hypothetical protein